MQGAQSGWHAPADVLHVPSIVNMLLSATYLYKLMPRSRFFGREQMTWWNRDDEREVEVVTGCFMLVRGGPSSRSA